MKDKTEKRKIRTDRKGAATWISWVLIMAFTVALGTFVFRWSSGYAESSAGDIGDRSARSSCDSAAIEISSACQTEGVIYATIENKKDLRIDQIVFSLFDIFGNAESREKAISLGVGESVNADVIKSGTISVIKATPAFTSRGKFIACPEREVEYSNITYC